jgi:DNA modification methylase
MMPVTECKPHPKNRNKHPDDQLKRLASILNYQGWRYPVKVSKRSGYVTSGHGRIEAAKINNWPQVPVNLQDYDDDEMEYADVQSDNAIASWAELDLAGINADIGDLGPDFDLDLLGIKDFELEPADKYADKDADSVPEVKESISKSGDVYELGNHRLLCGDCTDVDSVNRLVGAGKVDMVFTDPPYGVSYESKTKSIANQSKSRVTSKIQSDDLSVDELKEVIQQAFHNIYSVLADKSSYYIASPLGGELGLMMMMMMQEAFIPCRHMIIWVKNAPVFSMGMLDYDYQHEPILFGWAKNKTHHKSTQKGQWKSSVWSLAKEPNKLHPTMKPVELMVNAITNSCPNNGRVYDPFGGSGSTLIACEKTNRKCFMMEIDPHYIDVIVSRWCKFTDTYTIKRNNEEIQWPKWEDQKKK